MKERASAGVAVRAGDISGRATVYTVGGTLILYQGEQIQRTASGWDMNVSTPWRKILPKVVFLGYNTKATSTLYITSLRIVLIREIDSWREAASDMTVLGMPTAIAKEVRLKQLKAAGIRQFCELFPEDLRVAKSRRSTRHGSWLGLLLEDSKGARFAISFWKTDGEDSQVLDSIETRFARLSTN